MLLCRLSAVACFFLFVATSLAADEATLVGTVVDQETGKLVASRIYIQSAVGEWHFPKSAEDSGTAIEYRKARSPQSVEMHTTLSADPFVFKGEPGTYTITIERGKEYSTLSSKVELKAGENKLRFALRRWINMAELDWYSGETHVHREVKDLPTLQIAEDLNVSFPLTYWVTQGEVPPGRGKVKSPNVKPELIKLDDTHVIYPLNTEYEIFTMGGKRHTLGAIFALNHKKVFEVGAPPVKPIARQAHEQGALLELDKHNWPWSMMLVPVMNVDLYELTNNHIWRTKFMFTKFAQQPPAYMSIETDENGMTERGWIDFTFKNYYALLNCGFRLRPTGGTASGVHPVPLGFGRVYVHVPGRFSYDDWIKGLDAGRSFVTTGPMMDVRVNDELPGGKFAKPGKYRVTGWVHSDNRQTSIELIANGRAISIEPENTASKTGGYRSRIDTEVEIDSSTWICVRCFEETPEKRPRFAHTAPWHIDVAGRPVRPRRDEVRYFIERMEEEIQRHEGVLSKAAVDEYREALRAYQAIEKKAP